jgi:phage repressor protein C with HTH and peptisase S24 domain
MAPTLPDGSLILVQASEWQVERAGIYAFSRGGEVFVKRLTPIRSQGNGPLAALAILSDNPAWPPELVTGEEMNDIRVVGRVRACISRTEIGKIA